MSAQASGVDEDREALAKIVKDVSVRWAGPSMAEFANTPPIRKHYATADAILADGFHRQDSRSAQAEPSDVRADAVAQAILDHDEDRHTCYDHDGFCCPCGGLHDATYRDWERHRARAVLQAAGGVA